MNLDRTPVWFHRDQLDFKPLYEWAFGERINHPETTARAESILAALQDEPSLYELRAPTEVPREALRSIHSMNLLTLYNTARDLPDGQAFYPTVFPRSNQGAADPTNIRHAGAFCFDAGTPLNAQTWTAAAWSAACAAEAALAVGSGDHPLAYALSRPPGHHATRDLFGGYCYFNNAVIAVDQLRARGRVAVVDIDFHHGNGTQSLLWDDPTTLVINIHGDPRDFFPWFAGFAHETGGEHARGLNMNFPLPGGCDGQAYREVLNQHVAPAIQNFAPDFLVLSAGLDGYHLDPIGHFALLTEDFRAIGEFFGRLHLPTVVVQEGGYHAAHLGRNALALLGGLRTGLQSTRDVFPSP